MRAFYGDNEVPGNKIIYIINECKHIQMPLY